MRREPVYSDAEALVNLAYRDTRRTEVSEVSRVRANAVAVLAYTSLDMNEVSGVSNTAFTAPLRRKGRSTRMAGSALPIRVCTSTASLGLGSHLL